MDCEHKAFDIVGTLYNISNSAHLSVLPHLPTASLVIFFEMDLVQDLFGDFEGHYVDKTQHWSAAWPSLELPWIDADAMSSKIEHEEYLHGRRCNLFSEGFPVDPYLGKPSITADALPSSWQSYYRDLKANKVENFGRATNNTVSVGCAPQPGE